MPDLQWVHVKLHKIQKRYPLTITGITGNYAGIAGNYAGIVGNYAGWNHE